MQPGNRGVAPQRPPSYPEYPPGYPTRPPGSGQPRVAVAGEPSRPAPVPARGSGWSGATPRPQNRTAEARPGLSLTGTGALLLLLAAGAVGAVIDTLLSPALGTATTVLLAVGTLLASWLVRRSALFWIVIAPPLVYLVLVAGSLLAGAGVVGLAGVAAGVVYGFPAMAIATVISVVVAAVRQLGHR